MKMPAQSQLIFLCISFLSGFVFGLIYEVFYFLRLICGSVKGRRKTVEIVLDICFFLAFAVWEIYVAYVFRFPSFRAYVWLGCFLGLIIYLKSLHKIIAFLENLCYNKIVKKIKQRKKLLKRGEKKEL